MLDLNPDTVYRLLDLAREFHARESLIDTGETVTADDAWAEQLLNEHGDDPVFEEFRSAVRDLEPDQQQQLVGLLWLGREDYDIAEWHDLLDECRYHWTPHTAEYLLAHPHLPDYWEQAMDAHGYSRG